MTSTRRRTLTASLKRFIAASLALLVLAPLGTATAQQPAQGGSVGGRVTDEAGAPIVGADIIVEQTTIGTRTGGDGNYVLPTVPVGDRSVRVRMIGFRSQ